MRKRQSCACDLCRKAKKKCDGNSPCSRCTSRKKICTYSPFARHSKKTKELSSKAKTTFKTQQQAIQMSNNLACTHYVDLYSSRLNPAINFIGVSRNSLGSPQTKSELLQYNAVLATSARYLGEKNLYASFEKRARQLASELMEDFTYETVIGFYLFSFHLWGESDDKACHYRDITKSIFKRTPMNTCDQTSSALLKLNIFSINELGCIPNHKSIRDTISQLVGIPDSELKSFIVFLVNWLTKLHSYFGSCENDGSIKMEDAVVNQQANTSEETFQELFLGAEELHQRCKKYFGINSDMNSTIDVMRLMHFALVYYGARKMRECFEQIVEVLKRLENPVSSGFTPYFVNAMHFLFVIAFRERKYTIANRISGVVRNIALVLPSAVKILGIQMDMLRCVNLADEDKSIPLPDFPSVIPFVKGEVSESSVMPLLQSPSNPPCTSPSDIFAMPPAIMSPQILNDQPTSILSNDNSPSNTIIEQSISPPPNTFDQTCNIFTSGEFYLPDDAFFSNFLL